ncbi:hypothetical protein BLNAU_13388 [Blattamonas nauphoetae]|uniref:Uncharacterized protein n=1 Tax=Blattamonas nauphoetae TaxID=2049346 RepID=A0ABQ9XIU0_9EUKA|nr:hypothetical protein BLNAU_13388 [Blattamonas nauphoetae]
MDHPIVSIKAKLTIINKEHHNFKRVSSEDPEYSPFLNWSKENHGSESEQAVVFQSLVATVKVQPVLDASLKAKAVEFLKSVRPRSRSSADAFLLSLALSLDESSASFVQSIGVLVLSANQIITTAAIEMVADFIPNFSAQIRLPLVKADLIPQLIFTLNPLSLSFEEAVYIHANLMKTITNSAWFSTPDGLEQLGIEDDNEQQTVHETILKQVLVPSEKNIWHLCINRFSIIDGDQSLRFLELLANILEICPSHQRTMDFVLNMPIFLTIPSYLTFFEADYQICWNVIESKHQNDQDEDGDGGWVVDDSIRWNNIETNKNKRTYRTVSGIIQRKKANACRLVDLWAVGLPMDLSASGKILFQEPNTELLYTAIQTEKHLFPDTIGKDCRLKLQTALDGTLEAKAVNFLHTVDPNEEESADEFLGSFASLSHDHSTEFVQSMIVLVSSASDVITTTTMKVLDSLIIKSSPDVLLALVKADLFSQLINTLNPLSLSFTEAEDIHTSLISTITWSAWLSTPDGFALLEIEDNNEQQAVHETVFQQVMAPSEKWARIWMMSKLGSDQNEYRISRNT